MTDAGNSNAKPVFRLIDWSTFSSNGITKAQVKKVITIWAPIVLLVGGHHIAEWCEAHHVNWDLVESALVSTAVVFGYSASKVNSNDAQNVANKMASVGAFVRDNSNNPELIAKVIDSAKNGTLESSVPEALKGAQKETS